LAVGVHGAQAGLRVSNPLRRRLAVPGDRLGVVLRRAQAVGVHDAQPILRIGITALCCGLKFRERGGILQTGLTDKSQRLIAGHGVRHARQPNGQGDGRGDEKVVQGFSWHDVNRAETVVCAR
jgi:hypothetical protein